MSKRIPLKIGTVIFVKRGNLMFKRSITYFICSVIMLSLLCSCGKNDTGSSSYVQTGSTSSTSSPSQEGSNEPESSLSSQATNPNANNQLPSVNEDDKEWMLRLVNKDYPLKADLEFEKELIYSTSNGNYYFDKRAAKPLKDMMAAAYEDGVSLWLVSTCRTIAIQQRLLNNAIQSYINLGYSRADAEKEALRYTAPANASEHLTGLAVDFNSLDESFENTKAFKWLKANCADYGFILRYTREKEHITKYGYEPWHYRYVGVEAAKQIMSQGITLEEYLGKT